MGAKKIKMIYAQGGTREQVVNRPTSSAERLSYCLNDDEVFELANAAILIEGHYSKQAGEFRAMDIEWAKDGVDGKLYIVQARPETAISQRSKMQIEQFVFDSQPTKSCIIRASGRAVGEKIATGKVLQNRDFCFNF